MADSEPRLLVVDDNESSLETLSRRLRRKGFAVLTATSGKAALEIAALEQVDVVVLDMTMPGMGGIEVLNRLRGLPRRVPIPVVMITARADASDMVLALEQGADDYVSKPIVLEVLVARIRALLRRRPGLSAQALAPVPPMPEAVSPAILAPVDSIPGTRQMQGRALPVAPTVAYIGPGTVLEGKYRVDVLIGSGGFGSVYKAVHMTLKKTVAIKVLHAHLLSSEATVRRFQIEGISGCRIKHPNAVAIFDASSTQQGVPYLVMEYLEGVTLDAELRANGVMPFRRLSRIVVQVCDVLATAHATGVIHRDIKPANIHLSRKRTSEIVKVLDFGLAKLLESEDIGQVTSGESLIGTPQFMAPERLLGKPADGRADVYSLGATIYLCMTGRLPFGSNEDSMVSQALKQVNSPPVSVEHHRPDLPEELVTLIMRTLSRKRSDRPPLEELKRKLIEIAQSWEEAWPPHIPPAGKPPPMLLTPLDSPNPRNKL